MGSVPPVLPAFPGTTQSDGPGDIRLTTIDAGFYRWHSTRSGQPTCCQGRPTSTWDWRFTFTGTPLHKRNMPAKAKKQKRRKPGSPKSHSRDWSITCRNGERFELGGSGTEWADYYDITNYTTDSLSRRKRTLVAEYIELADPKMIWDVGANNGEFSRIGSGKGIFTVSSDIDPSRCGEKLPGMP